MKALSLLFLLPTLFLGSGCAGRIFQTEVPKPVVKQEAQVEAEREAADLIAQKIETPRELKPVAISLSSSLGPPKKSLVDVREFDLPKAAVQANSGLVDGIQKMQKQLDQLNVKLTKLQGKDIEGTGISLLGPSTLTILAVLVALGVFFPPAFTFLLFAFKRMKATAGMVVEQIDEASKADETKAAMAALKKKLGDVMNTENKQVIHDLQKP